VENYTEIIEHSKEILDLGLKLNRESTKNETLINQRSNWSPRRYCKYV